MRSLCVQIDTELRTACLGGKISRGFFSTNYFFMYIFEDVTGYYELIISNGILTFISKLNKILVNVVSRVVFKNTRYVKPNQRQ